MPDAKIKSQTLSNQPTAGLVESYAFGVAEKQDISAVVC